jgi:hypothetical protein
MATLVYLASNFKPGIVNVSFVVDVCQEQALVLVRFLIQGIVPVLSLNQHPLDPRSVSSIVQKTTNVIANNMVFAQTFWKTLNVFLMSV